ncbi:MAG: cytochrome P460 family protein [Candidatus Rokubacteria bacterium]|nr:cytochrome P460 family protein [Candidatus Rokubacteria bacterium]MBI4628516.1 cytochrome P460 family protein [Candidatus Rokubacteria bacterium]
MKRRVITPLVVTALALLAAPGSAGPEKIAFPAGYKSHVLYATVDRYDIKQHRELYGTPEAVQAAKAGRPIPSGSVLTLVQYKAQVDAQGTPVKDASGRFVKGDVIALTVMEKRAGWGAEYPADLRNGDWEYAAFSPDGKLNEKANYKACFQCHKPHEKQDFVISLASLAGKFPTGAVATKTGANDVTVAGFAFGPKALTVGPGQSVTWTNADNSPHQIALAKSQERSPVLLKGQSHSRAFAAPGVYDYMCGLHPSMKGSIEVK